MREAQAGLAACLQRLGEEAAATALVDDLLPHLVDGLEGAQRERAWLHCWQVLQAAGDPQAPQLREQIAGLLQQRAALVGDEHAEEYLSTPAAVALLA